MSQYSIKKQAFENYEFSDGKLLTTFQRKALLKNLQSSLHDEYCRRIEIMLLADMGKSQTQICLMLGCSRQMARYWIAIARAGMAHQWNEPPIGRPKTVNEEYIDRLKELVSQSPREYGYGFNCWTAQWLSKHLAQEFDIEISDRHINRLLAQMGLSKKQKRKTRKQTTDFTQDSGIKIYDLQSKCQPNLHLSFNQLIPINK